MTSSPIYDEIAPILMTSFDSVQQDMIQSTYFYDPVMSYLKRGIFFELLWTNFLIQGVFKQPFQWSQYKVV